MIAKRFSVCGRRQVCGSNIRKRVRSLFTLWLVLQITPVFAATESLSLAADYYYTRHDFRQAFQLWKEVFKRQPDSVRALMRVTELKLMFESRQSSRDTLLKFLETNEDRLEPKVKKNLREHLGTLQSTFVSDEVQSTYLQAKPRLRYKDWAGALVLLNQALSQDPGNFSILKDKALCEFKLAQWEKFADTTKLAYEAFPYDNEVLENHLESMVYRKDFAAVVAVGKKDPELLISERLHTSYAFALLELGPSAEATAILQGMLEEKRGKVRPAILYYSLGKALFHRGTVKTDTLRSLEKFLSTVPNPLPTSEVWDPYHLSEKVEESKKMIAELTVG